MFLHMNRYNNIKKIYFIEMTGSLRLLPLYEAHYIGIDVYFWQ